MLPVGTMEDETCRISLHQHIAAAPPASAIRAIKATDFSIAAIIGSSSSSSRPTLHHHHGEYIVKPSSPESANSKPNNSIFHFGKSTGKLIGRRYFDLIRHVTRPSDPVKSVLPKQETVQTCKTEESEDIDIEKDVDVEEFSDAENVSASSPSALSCEDEQEEDEEDEDAKSKSSSHGNKSGGGGKSSGGGRNGGKKKSRSEPVNHLIKPRCNCDELTTVDCQLETKELWDKFHELGTEMIITKTGRSVIAAIFFFPFNELSD
jgi:hypothetical protein